MVYFLTKKNVCQSILWMVLPTVVMRLKEYKNELKKVDPESSSSKAKSFGNNSPFVMTSLEYFPSLV